MAELTFKLEYEGSPDSIVLFDDDDDDERYIDL